MKRAPNSQSRITRDEIAIALILVAFVIAFGLGAAFGWLPGIKS